MYCDPSGRAPVGSCGDPDHIDSVGPVASRLEMTGKAVLWGAAFSSKCFNAIGIPQGFRVDVFVINPGPRMWPITHEGG